jgi:glycosyltransferase involved in cell wall biosynthesis/SAM-dependent methyltransferase
MDLVLGQQHIDLVQYADYAMARSYFMARELSQTGLISTERIYVTPLGTVETPVQTAVTTSMLVERYQLSGKRVLLYVGRMARNKRVTDLVEALAHVHQYYPDTVLLLVGENQFGPYRDYATEVARRAAELGCQEQVIFTGQVPDLTPYYQVCDLFVTASVHEGFGMPVIEAMAHGKPVIAAAATALIETVGDGGLLFEPENPSDLAHKIVELLNAMPEAPTVSFLPVEVSVTTPATTHEWSDIRAKVIAFVTPRYGTEIVGGAERLIRGWAEHLASQGYTVEVLTTCTIDMSNWSNQYAPGVEQINGVTVRRFGIDPVDSSVFHRVQYRAGQNETITYSDEMNFMRNNFQSSALNSDLQNHSADFVCVIFAPYLFGTTYWGIQAVAEKAIIVPCLHDEPVAYFSVIREMLEGATGVFFNTQAECDFATNTLGVVNPARAVVGYGFDLHAVPGNVERFRTRYQLPDHFLLYSGRLEEGKNVPLLWDYFIRYKQEHPGELALVLTGAKSIPVPEHRDIIALGIIPEAEMPDAFAAALALCQPSLNESFSIVLMESWLQDRPVLVHANCAVTREHVVRSGGGSTFDTYASFAAAVDHLLQHPEQAHAMGQRGHAYVQQYYAWDVIRSRIFQGITAFTQEQNSYTRLAQRGVRRSLAFTPMRFADALLRAVEQARSVVPLSLQHNQKQQLQQLARVNMPEYTIQSRLPVIGRLVAWTRKQLTSHLKEPYFDPIIERQTAFNQQIVQTLVSLLEQNIYEQHRLRREPDIMREHLAHTRNIEQELDQLWQFAHGHPQNDELFLHSAYQSLLKRTPDAAGYAYYAQALQSSKLTKRAIMDALMQSDEHKHELYTLPMQPPEALHRARLILFQHCLPSAQKIVDLGGAAHDSPEGALLVMGYPYDPQEIIIIDLPPMDRIGGVDMAESTQTIVTDNGVCVRYLYSSMTDMSPFADESIDLVVSGESIEHITEADADIVCREAYRILKPGGYFCLDTPNAALTRLQSPHALTHPEHKKEYYAHELRAKLEQCGFVITEAKGICPMPMSLKSGVFDYKEMVQNISLSDNPDEGYLFFLKAVKP